MIFTPLAWVGLVRAAPLKLGKEAVMNDYGLPLSVGTIG